MTDYQHRSCLACGKRIPRWTKGKKTPVTKVFCDDGCRAYYRRTHPTASRPENAKKVPVKRAFLEPVRADERPPEHEPCLACGRPCRIVPGQATYCNERCRTYAPLSPRKPDGEWFIVAGPIDYCAECGLAITNRWRKGDKLYCSAACRDISHVKPARTREAVAA